jgi:DNA-binding transcriptional regulator LsrR (DeoR family)
MPRRRTGRPRGPPRIDQRVRAWVQTVWFGRHATQTEIARFLRISQSSVARMVSEYRLELARQRQGRARV